MSHSIMSIAEERIDGIARYGFVLSQLGSRYNELPIRGRQEMLANVFRHTCSRLSPRLTAYRLRQKSLQGLGEIISRDDLQVLVDALAGKRRFPNTSQVPAFSEIP